MQRTIFSVVSILCIFVVYVSNAISEGPKTLLERSGFIVDTKSDLKECKKVNCVSGMNCSDDSSMKCGKFEYCAEYETNISSGSSSSFVMDSSYIVIVEECSAGLPLGKECRNSTDCIDYWAGAYCSAETHLCTRARVLNEACNANTTCAFPLQCEGGLCVNKYSLTSGQECDPKNKENGGCHLSLYCNTATNKCTEFPGLGEDCNDDVGCALPYFCSPTKNVCLAPMSRKLGESCVTSLDCNENLICARNQTCVEPLSNYTDAVNCTKNEDCLETSYCHCDYVSGVSMCLPLPLSANMTLDLFNTLLSCVNLDPDLSVARCQLELVDVQRAANASAIIDFECSRLPSLDNSIDLLLLLVPVIILVSILGLVLIVKLGIPTDK